MKKTRNKITHFGKCINIRLPNGLYNTLKEISELSYVSVSSIIRSAIIRYVGDYENEETIE